jgi:formylglycine-generating enzyme required for sulfatase activity
MDSSFEDQQNPSNIATVWTKFNNALQAINQNLKTHPIETFQLENHFNITEIEE